jgi:hypothetical protein
MPSTLLMFFIGEETCNTCKVVRIMHQVLTIILSHFCVINKGFVQLTARLPIPQASRRKTTESPSAQKHLVAKGNKEDNGFRYQVNNESPIYILDFIKSPSPFLKSAVQPQSY